MCVPLSGTRVPACHANNAAAMPHATQRALTATIYNGGRFIAFSQGTNAS
jgi:hypothetical protein